MPAVAKPKKARSPKEYADIVSMRTERKKLYLDAVAINQKAIGEKRDMSAQEKEQFDTLYSKVNHIDDRVEKLEAMSEDDEEPEDDEEDDEEDDTEDDNPESDSERSRHTNRRGERRSITRDQNTERNPHSGRRREEGNRSRYNLRPIVRKPGENDREFNLRSRRNSEKYIDDTVQYFLNGNAAVSGMRAVQADLDIVGGYMVMPEVIADKVLKKVDNIIQLESLAEVMFMENAQSMGVPTIDSDPADSDWTSEIATIQADSSMTMGKRAMTPFPLRKRLLVSERWLRMAIQAAFVSADDNNGKSATKDDLITNRMAYKLAAPKESAFFTGNGVNKPLGMFTASSRGVSTARDVVTGSTTNYTYAGLVNAKYALKTQYHQNANWFIHRLGMSKIMQLVDSNGRPLLNFSTLPDQPTTLLQCPVRLSEYVPSTFTSGLYVGMLCDPKFYYIVNSMELRIKVAYELYAEKGQVGFFAATECDGMPVLEEAFSRLITN